MKRKS
jgi:hypothetical protein